MLLSRIAMVLLSEANMVRICAASRWLAGTFHLLPALFPDEAFRQPVAKASRMIAPTLDRLKTILEGHAVLHSDTPEGPKLGVPTTRKKPASKNKKTARNRMAWLGVMYLTADHLARA
jgi:hypothetical protein